MKIYFVRHGKTQGNIEERYNVGDEVLVAEGKEDLKSKKAIYDDIEFDYIYSSPLTRCKETFEILFPQHEVDEYREDLVEMDFGDWAGEKYSTIIKEMQGLGYTLEDFVDPVNGETYDSLFARTTNFLNEITQKHNNGETVLVLAHGLVIAAILKQHFLKDEIIYFLSPDNGLGYVIEIDDDNIELTKIKQ